MKKDIFGVAPQVGDTIIFNPPKYKGLLFGKCVGLTKVGLPKVSEIKGASYDVAWEVRDKGWYSPKTGFVVKREDPLGPPSTDKQQDNKD